MKGSIHGDNFFPHQCNDIDYLTYFCWNKVAVGRRQPIDHCWIALPFPPLPVLCLEKFCLLYELLVSHPWSIVDMNSLGKTVQFIVDFVSHGWRVSSQVAFYWCISVLSQSKISICTMTKPLKKTIVFHNLPWYRVWWCHRQERRLPCV